MTVTHVEPLVDVLVHTQDILRPLGRVHEPPAEAAAVAADRCRLLAPLWAAPAPSATPGCGPPTSRGSAGAVRSSRGPALELLMLCAGREPRRPWLTGDGVAASRPPISPARPRPRGRSASPRRAGGTRRSRTCRGRTRWPRRSSVEQPHLLQGQRHDLRAVRRLGSRPRPVPVAPRQVAVAAAQPAPGQPGGARERDAVEPGDGPQRGVLLGAADLGGELAQPRRLAVDLLPADDRVAQVVELDAAVVVAGPARPAASGRARRATSAAAGRRARAPSRRG